MTINIGEIISFLDKNEYSYSFTGDKNVLIEGFSSLGRYRKGTVTWIKNKDNLTLLGNVKTCDLIVAQSDIKCDMPNVIYSENSKQIFFSIIEQFFSYDSTENKHRNNSIIDDSVVLGENVKIGYNCSILGNVAIGDNTIIHNNVTIINNVSVGKNCTIQSGTVIGHDDFSYTEDETNVKTMIKHYGGVVIEDDVFIGPNSVICRGTIDNTLICKGTKMDAFCHISHNSVIGTNNALISGTKIYGSVTTGNNVYIASSIIKNQLHIGDNATVGMNSTVIKDVLDGETVVGTPAKKLVR